MSALSAHQSPTLPQKIDSREGLLWCKKGLACACGKMNFYLNCPPLTPVFQAFFSKMECVLLLNGVHFGAKCNAFWYKMECVLVLNARYNGTKWKVKWC